MQAEQHAFLVTDSSLWLILVAQSDAKNHTFAKPLFIEKHVFP